MTREKMQNNIIKKYGFEAWETLYFCKRCEEIPEVFEQRLKVIYKAFMRGKKGETI